MSVRTHLPTLVVGLVGGILGASLVGGAAYAANGGYLILGATNYETKATTISNAYGTALALRSKAGTAPFAVGNAVKVANLNSDRLDNLDSTAFALAGGQVAYVHASAQFQVDWSGDTVNDAVATSATCPVGTKLVSGGYDIDPGTEVLSSSPYSDNSWYVVTNGTGSDVYDMYAVCWNPRGAVPGGTAVVNKGAATPFAQRH